GLAGWGGGNRRRVLGRRFGRLLLIRRRIARGLHFRRRRLGPGEDQDRVAQLDVLHEQRGGAHLRLLRLLEGRHGHRLGPVPAGIGGDGVILGLGGGAAAVPSPTLLAQ